MARDWRRAFRPAFYRGVPFKVDAEEPAGARRLAVSPIAYSDTNVIEDMGGEPRVVRVSAYCAGEISDAEALALSAVLGIKGAGLLVLPWMPPLRARAASWRARRVKDFAGHVGFDIEFLEEGLGSVPFGGLAGIGTLAEAMRAGASMFRGAFG